MNSRNNKVNQEKKNNEKKREQPKNAQQDGFRYDYTDSSDFTKE